MDIRALDYKIIEIMLKNLTTVSGFRIFASIWAFGGPYGKRNIIIKRDDKYLFDGNEAVAV